MHTGSETTATVISAAVMMLAIHPEYQDRLVAELHNVFNDADEPVTKEHIAKLREMDLVLKETMRLYPPISICSLFGRCTELHWHSICPNLIVHHANSFAEKFQIHNRFENVGCKNPNGYSHEVHQSKSSALGAAWVVSEERLHGDGALSLHWSPSNITLKCSMKAFESLSL